MTTFDEFIAEREVMDAGYEAMNPFQKGLTKRFWRKPWNWIKTAWYWIRTHTYNRYHIINLSGEDGYDWGYIDTDSAMLIACFKLLRDFVENEDPGVGTYTLDDYGPFNFDGEKAQVERQIERDAEVRALYNWWCFDRIAEQAQHNTIKDYNWSFERDQEMLQRLIAVRGCLWT